MSEYCNDDAPSANDKNELEKKIKALADLLGVELVRRENKEWIAIKIPEIEEQRRKDIKKLRREIEDE